MVSGSRGNGRPRCLGDRLRLEALPQSVAANALLVRDLRRALDWYSTSTDPDWPLGREIGESFKGDRAAAAKVAKALRALSRLIREAGIYARFALHQAFPGDGEAVAQAFEQWRAALDEMAANPNIHQALVVKGRPGPRFDFPLYSMCTNAAVAFRLHGVRATTTDTGPLADTLREMLRVVKGGRQGVENIRPYLRWAVEESREHQSLGLKTAKLGLVEQAVYGFGKGRIPGGS